MSTTFRKRKPRAPRAVATVAHPGQTSFVEFARVCGPVIDPKFEITQQLRLFAFLVEDSIVKGKSWLRLILVWPPGSGKTWTGMLFLAWVYGLHPTWHELALSLSAELASSIGSTVKAIIESDEYKQVFPTIYIAPDSASKKHFKIQTTNAPGRGEFNAVGRSTRFTGRRGHIIYQDDLINEKEADSPVALEDAKKTIRASYSRGHPAGYHWIVCNTRYREDDPVGYMLDKYAEEGPWTLIALPSIVESEGEQQPLPNGWLRPVGDVLYPFQRDKLLARKATYFADGVPHEWYGQHKGMPRPAGGRELDLAWFKRYDEQPAAVRRRCDRVIVSVDPAKRDKETNDPTAILVWGEQGDRKYLLHVELDRMLFDALLVKLAKVCLEWKPNLLLMEQAGSGEQATQYLRKFRSVTEMLPDGRKQEIVWKTDIVEIEVAGGPNKILRFKACTPDIRQGFVWLPVKAPWLEKYESELVNFPRVSHDDQADATSQYLNWIRLNTAHTAPQASAPADVSRAVSPLGGIHSGRGGGGNFLTRW